MPAPSPIARIHASPLRAMLVVTGGGSQAIADLLAVPGASRTVLEVVIPYSAAALSAWLGFQPPQAVSADTATALARAASTTGWRPPRMSSAWPSFTAGRT